MSKEIYISVLSCKFNGEFWKLRREHQDEVFNELEEYFAKSRKSLIHLRTYRSVRHSSDLLVWLSSFEPESLITFKEGLKRALKGIGDENYSMLSLYEHSPYLKAGEELSKSLNFPPLKYFVCYPMNKEPDWYLIDSKERKTIMGEHIAMATSNPENNDIRSYTTYSYGISDQEFVVMYETDSLSDWSHVTQKLREARQRKWVTKEYPIFVGLLTEPFRF